MVMVVDKYGGTASFQARDGVFNLNMLFSLSGIRRAPRLTAIDRELPPSEQQRQEEQHPPAAVFVFLSCPVCFILAFILFFNKNKTKSRSEQ